MPLVKNVEKKVWDIQGFDIKFKTPEGKDVRDDKRDMPQYTKERASKNDMTVSEFKTIFRKQYPGYDLDVLTADGEAVNGNMKLGTVRDTYNEADE
ncbi:hypothetical protein D3C80_1748300 [compost metagenome]